MADTTAKAVFLSYASQDAEAARRIAEALRAVGVEVWFDQNELVGGDAWDAKIRKQIAACALFVPIISATTDARPEGYFRLEWLLAVERARLMADDHPFLFPIAVGDVHESTARVPEKFRAVQWTPLRDDASAEAFARLVQRALHPPVTPASSRPVQRLLAVPAPGEPALVARRRRVSPWVAIGCAIAAAVLGWMLWPSGRPPVQAAAPAAAEAGTVAILPFTVARPLEADVEFADSLHDEVISALTRIRALRVLSREAVQPYRGPAQRNRETIARQLRVNSIVEVLLLREGTRVKIDAQLLNARTGALEWSETFRAETAAPEDRAALPGLVARKIAAALRVTPSGAEQAPLASPPTRNAEAYALYQRMRLNYARAEAGETVNEEEQIKLLRAAVAKDRDFAPAYAQLVKFHTRMYWFTGKDRSPARKSLAKEALDHAVRLAPEAPETQLARGMYLYRCERDYRRALEAFVGAEDILPGDAEVKQWIAQTLRRLGRLKESLTIAEAALALEPRNLSLLDLVTETCLQFRRFEAAVDYGRRYVEVAPRRSYRWLVRAAYELSGDKAQFERDMFPFDEGTSRASDLRPRYGAALFRENYEEAARLLEDPRLWSQIFLTPVVPSLRAPEAAPSVHRAYLALQRSDHEAAKLHANEALKRLGREVQTEEDGYIVRVAMAEMMAIAGHGEAAVVAMKKELAELARRDAFEELKHQPRLACVYAAAGMSREALDQLARLMQQPCDATPSELHDEPMLSSLRGSPEFERILASARKL